MLGLWRQRPSVLSAKIGNKEAVEKLRWLAESEEPFLQEKARRQLGKLGIHYEEQPVQPFLFQYEEQPFPPGKNVLWRLVATLAAILTAGLVLALLLLQLLPKLRGGFLPPLFSAFNRT